MPHHTTGVLSFKDAHYYLVRAKSKEGIFSRPHMMSFQGGVGMFDLIFLSCFSTKIGSFCAHWKGNILNVLKLTLVLSLAHF